MELLAPGAGCAPARDVDDFAADRAGSGLGELAGGEVPRGQVSQGAVLQIGVDLLDPGMFAVNLVGSNSVQCCGVNGTEEGVEAVRVKERWLSISCFRVQLGNAAHDHPVGDALGLPPSGERSEWDFRDFGH